MDIWVVKLDGDGNKLWDKTIGGTGGEDISSLIQTLDGGYILGGTSSSGITGDKTANSKGNGDFWLVKLANNGSKLWDKTIGGNDYDVLNSISPTSDGGYILGGRSRSPMSGDKTEYSRGNDDLWVVKLDNAFNKIWDKTIGTSAYENLIDIIETTNGYILGSFTTGYISGDKTAASKGGYDNWLVKLGNNGNKIWDKTFGGIDGDILLSINKTSGDGLILGGFSNSGLSGDKSQASKGGNDFWIVKLGASPTGIKESETNFNLSISPNPNQGKFNLQLSNLTASKAAVTISDMFGQVVLQKEILSTNNQISKELTLPNAKGIYLLQFKAGEQNITRKIVVE